MHFILPSELSVVPGSVTSMPTVTPMICFTGYPTCLPAARAASRRMCPPRSMRTVSASRFPYRVSTHWKCAVSSGTSNTSSSIWVGKTVHPSKDHRVVAAPGDLLNAAHGPRRAGQESDQVAGAVADHRHRLLGHRGEARRSPRQEARRLLDHGQLNSPLTRKVNLRVRGGFRRNPGPPCRSRGVLSANWARQCLSDQVSNTRNVERGSAEGSDLAS
jgi:hypothetical protein